MKLVEGKTYFRNVKTGKIFDFEPLLDRLGSPNMIKFIHSEPVAPKVHKPAPPPAAKPAE